MQKIVYTVILSLFLSLFLVRCSDPADDVIVTVGKREIKRSQVVALLKTKYPEQADFKDIDISMKKDLLEPVILRSLRVNAAIDMGLHDDPEFLDILENYKMRVIGSKYYERVVLDKVVSEKEVEDYLERQGIELKARHILIGYRESQQSENRSREESLALATKISRELKDGADFIALNDQYSNDPSAKKNKGELGYFTWGKMIKEFQAAAWNMEVGSYSDPVQSVYGFHVINLQDRRSVENYKPDRGDENIYQIKRTLTLAYPDTGRILWTEHYKALRKKYHFTKNDAAIDQLVALFKEKIKNELITADSFSDEQKAILVAGWDGKEITLGTLIDQYNNNLSVVFGRFRERQVLQNDIDRMSMNGLVIFDAEQIGVVDDPIVIAQLEEFTETQMDRIVDRKRQETAIQVTAEETRDFYDRNPAKFKEQAEVELWQIDVKSEKLAKQIIAQVKQGSDFSALAKKYSTDKKFGPVGGYIGYVKMNTRAAVSRKAHEVGPNVKIAGPIEYRLGWSVIRTGKKIQERTLPYNEVEQRAANLVKYEKSLSEKTLWQFGLKEKYPVVFDEEKLSGI